MAHSPTVCGGNTGEECFFDCDPGYHAIRPRICNEDRRFQGGKCAPDSCSGGLTIQNSSVACQGVTEQQCQYVCNCGYVPEGAHICNTDGVFRGGVCTSCPAGHVSRGVSCSVCADGYEPSETGCDCIPCSAGHAGILGICQNCTTGRAPSADSSSCEACDIGLQSTGLECMACETTAYTVDGIECLTAADGMRPVLAGNDQERCVTGSAGLGGTCNLCGAGEEPNVEHTACEPCPRHRYNPDGNGCVLCDPGSVPIQTTGAVRCVLCTHQGTAVANGQEYANTDWDACSITTAVCNPGEQLSSDSTACESCGDIQPNNRFSPGGVRCEICEPGKEPAVGGAECVDCFPGQYSDNGVCLSCLNFSNTNAAAAGSYIAGESGSTRCTSCPAGKQPNVQYTDCNECPDGSFSTDGVCVGCGGGTTNSPDWMSCVGCETFGANRYGVGSAQCLSCATGKQPNQMRTACEDCPQLTLGRDGLCYSACEALGCTNKSMTIEPGADILDVTIDDLCPLASVWIGESGDRSIAVATASGNCTLDPVECDLQATEGNGAIIELGITGIVEDASSVCAQSITLVEARVIIEPAIVGVECLSTSYKDTTISVVNEGGMDVTIYGAAFNSTWIALERATDTIGQRVELPYTVSPGNSILMILRSSGTTIQPGLHVAAGTLTSSAGEEPLVVNLEVIQGDLRVVALPQTLPHVTLEAGTALSRYFTIYNVRNDGQTQWCVYKHLHAFALCHSAVDFENLPSPCFWFTSGQVHWQLHQFCWAAAWKPATSKFQRVWGNRAPSVWTTVRCKIRMSCFASTCGVASSI